MDKAMWDKLAAAGGIIGVAFFVIAALLVGQPPDVGDDAASIAAWFSDNADSIKWATLLQGLAVIAVIWFISALGAAMRDAGEGRLAAAMGIAFAITFSIGATAALSRGALAFGLGEGADDGVIAGVYRSAAYMDTASNMIGAAFFLAVGGASVRSKVLPAWWGWVTTLAGLWLIVSSTAWADNGFWSPDGAGMVSFGVFLLWVLISSILLVMRTGKSSTA